MDSELRRRFLQSLSFDFAALDLREMKVKRWSTGKPDWPVNGPSLWSRTRAWWRGELA